MFSIIANFFQQKPTDPIDRYAWLEDKMRKAIVDQEDIDDIYREEFNQISFANPHTEENYQTLINCIEMRDGFIGKTLKPWNTSSALYVKGNFSSIASEYASCYQTRPGVFSVDTICKLVNSIPSDNEAVEPWKIVYKVCALLNRNMVIDVSMVRETYDDLHKKLPDMADKPYFHYVVGVYDEIGVELNKFGSFHGEKKITTDLWNARIKLRSAGFCE